MYDDKKIVGSISKKIDTTSLTREMSDIVLMGE
jgi:hypothetical protein